MMIKKVLFIFIMLLFGLRNATAQDPSFSQFSSLPDYYNPAQACFYNEITFRSAYRNLWTKIPGNFGTDYLSFIYPTCYSNGLKGFSISATMDREGLNWMRTNSIGGSLITGIRTGVISVNAGATVFVTQKYINWDRLVFSDQLDEVKGIVFPTDFVKPNGNVSKVFGDVSFGLSMKYQEKSKTRYDHHPIIIGGVAWHHILEPDQSFTGYPSKLPGKYVVNLNAWLPFSWYSIEPGFIWETQEKFQTIMVGSNFSAQAVEAGIWYRRYNNSDAIVLYTGLSFFTDSEERSKIELGYSYDLTVSGLKYSSAGSHEFTLVYKFFKDCSKGKHTPKPGDCPPEFQRYKTKLTYNFKGWK